MNDYKTLASRLASLKTRIDFDLYNEIQGLIYNNDCPKLEDIPAKACRLITRCDVPETEICKVSQNFKTTIPPSHPPETMPWYILADLLPCYLEGRTICPEFELWDTFQGVGFPTDHVIRKDKADLGFGELWVQTEYSVWQSCCNECDQQYNYDYLRLQPSVDTWFVCGSDSFTGSDSVSKSFSLIHEKIHVSLKNTSSINVCDKEIHVEPDINIWSECSDTTGDVVSDSASVSLCNGTFLKGSVSIEPTLSCDGKITNAVDFNLELGDTGHSAPVGVITGLSASGTCLNITTNSLQFNHGILCNTSSSDNEPNNNSQQICLDLQDTIINLINNNLQVQNVILNLIRNNLGRLNICEYIKQNCDCCCGSDSGSASSSYSSDSVSTSSSSSCKCTYSYGTPNGSLHLGAVLSSETDNIVDGSVTAVLNSNGIPINMTANYDYDDYNQEYIFDFYVYGEEHRCINCIDQDIATNGITAATVTYTTSNDNTVHTATLALDNALTVTWSGTCRDCNSSDSISISGSQEDPCTIRLYEGGGEANITRTIADISSLWSNPDIAPWNIISYNSDDTITIQVQNNTLVSLGDLGLNCLSARDIVNGYGTLSSIPIRGFYDGVYTVEQTPLLDGTVTINITGNCPQCE